MNLGLQRNDCHHNIKSSTLSQHSDKHEPDNDNISPTQEDATSDSEGS